MPCMIAARSVALSGRYCSADFSRANRRVWAFAYRVRLRASARARMCSARYGSDARLVFSRSMIAMAAKHSRPPRPAIVSGHETPATKCRPTSQHVIDVTGGSETDMAAPHGTLAFISPAPPCSTRSALPLAGTLPVSLYRVSAAWLRPFPKSDTNIFLRKILCARHLCHEVRIFEA